MKIVTKIRLALTLGAFLFLSQAFAQLPENVEQALARARIPAQSVALMVQEVDSAQPLLEHNADQAMNPASVMKLVTSFAAIKKLGHQFTWQTHFLADHPIDEQGILQGNLYLRGGGDPFLTYDTFEALIFRLKRQGLKAIRGNIILDRSAFQLPPTNPSAFDGAPMRPYNTPANALLLDFQTIALEFSTSDGLLQVQPIVPLKDFAIDTSEVVLTPNTACPQGWHQQLQFTTEGKTLRIAGKMPSCAKEIFYIMPFDALTHAQMWIAAILEESAISFSGTIEDGLTPPSATLLLQHESEPLALALKSVNKYSNNVMARHLFLSLSLAQKPASIAKSQQVLKQIFAQEGLHFPELLVENGAGLSRRARISARHLNALLIKMWQDPLMPEMISSLPILGLDGTLKRRYKTSRLKGRAHLKTGSLNEVKALAGFFHAKNGKRFALCILIHSPQAYAAQGILDAFLEWLDQQNL